MNNFYYLPSEYIPDEHGALGECIYGILALAKPPSNRPTDHFTAMKIFDRIFNGRGQGGESVNLWQLCRWKDRESTDAGMLIRNLEILGEASNNIQKHYPEFATQHPELPLAFAYQMRNAVAHGYFKVDYEIVWKTIHADLPVLHGQVQNVVVNSE